LFVGGVLLFSGAIPLPANLQQSLQGIVPLNMIVFSGSLVVPSADDALPEIVTLAQNNSSSERMLVKIGADGKMIWQAEPLDGESAYLYPHHMLSAAGLVFVAIEDTLFAYQLSDGTTAWRASLSDSLYPSCESCLLWFDGYLVVVSTDGTVQGFDAQTGEDLWSRDLEASVYDLYRIGGAPAVLDEDEAGSALFFLDPASGEVTRRLTSSCISADEFYSSDLNYYDTTLFYDEPSNALYLIFGGFEGCVQRWDPSGETPDWDAHITSEEGFSSTYALTPLIDGETLYLSAEYGRLWAFDTATGERQTLVAEDDLRLVVLGALEGVVVVEAVETRGSYEYGLWGVEAASGEVLWKVDLDEAEPLLDTNTASGILSGGESAWMARVLSDGVMLVQAKSDPHQLILQRLDVRAGTPNTETVVPLNRVDQDSFYSVSLIDWRGERAWMLVDNHVYRLNTTTAEVETIWP
jgi:outer membrane protein assembly factor BamB